MFQRKIRSNPGPKPTLKTLLHTLTQSPTLTKYTNSPVQPSQSSPPPLSPAHSPTSVPSAKHTHIPQSIYSTAHTYIPQTTYWTSGCLPGGWCLCWQGCLNLLGCRTHPQLHAGGVGRRQQVHKYPVKF